LHASYPSQLLLLVLLPLLLLYVLLLCCSQRNLLGLNQKLSALVELGQSDSLFRLQWVDPWIRGDPNRTSMTVSMMNTR
jgi:outer membrane protein assembly factor BamA